MSKQSEPVVIKTHNLGYKTGHRTLLHSIDLKIEKGEVFIITGPSGSGKTTLAKIIARELIPTSGELFFGEGLKIEMVPQQDQFISVAGLRTTYYGQRYENPNDDGIPTVKYFLKKAVSKLQKNHFIEVVGELEIEYLLERKLLSLSNGERKRVQLAMAWLKNPDVLILDQPFIGLDVHSREKLHHIIEKRKNKGNTFVIVSDPDHISLFADKVLELKQGTVFKLVSGKEYLPVKLKEEGFINAAKKEFFKELISEKKEYRFVVRMREVNVSFNWKQVLHDINWEVKAGDQWVLMGPNGAGKTTLLSLISADNPQGYTNDLVLFDQKRGSGESIWDIKKKIGFVSPELHLYFLRQRGIYHPAHGAQTNYNSLNCLDVVLSGLNDEVGFNTSHSDRQIDLATKWLKILDMKHLGTSPFLYSSLGEQRIILLARALIKSPDLLILDEPCQGLDPTQTGHFLKVLDYINENNKTTMIYVTHRAEEIPSRVSHILKLETGKIKESGKFAGNL